MENSQDLTVADSTGTIKLTVWGNEVGKYETDSLQQMSIRTYNGCKYLNFPRECGSSTKIGDIGDVAKITDNSQHTSSSDIHNVRIYGVSRLIMYKSCVKCRSKAEVTSTKYARCTNASCKMLQKLDMTKETFSAILIITSPDITDKKFTLSKKNSVGLLPLKQMKLDYLKPRHFKSIQATCTIIQRKCSS